MATQKIINAQSDLSVEMQFMSLLDITESLKQEHDRLTAQGWTDLHIEFHEIPYDSSGNTYPFVCGKRLESIEEAEARETKLLNWQKTYGKTA